MNLSRTIGTNSIRPPLHLLAPTTTSTTLYRPTLFFSTADSDPSPSPLPTGTSSAQIEQLALQYAREANPAKAQELLEQLPKDSLSVPILWPSVLDAWLNYQKHHITRLKEALQELPLQQQQQEGEEEEACMSWRNHLDEICHAAESASQLIENDWNENTTTKKKITWDHVEVILHAWANACEAIRLVGVHITQQQQLQQQLQREWSGIPQRAQHILRQYQQLAATGGTKPTIECTNQVLRAWAFSGEHLRGTMAEQFFHSQKAAMNVETYRYLIRAWSWSKEKRAAYAANGYFFRMMRLLEGGQEDMVPTLEDYQVLFRAWATTE